MNFLIKFKEIKYNFFRKENIYFLILIIITFLLDRISKSKIISNFNDRAYFVNDYLNFELFWNTGIGFGLLSSTSNLFYNVITIIIALIIFFLLCIALNSRTSEKIFFSLIIGGAIGNFYDRIIFKAVPDFIDLHYNSFHWFTFNIADIFITAGIVFILTSSFKVSSFKEKN
jgi:signal peptidase II